MRDARPLVISLLLATPFACGSSALLASNGIAQPVPPHGSGGTFGSGGTLGTGGTGTGGIGTGGIGTGGIGPGGGTGGIGTGGTGIH